MEHNGIPLKKKRTKNGALRTGWQLGRTQRRFDFCRGKKKGRRWPVWRSKMSLQTRKETLCLECLCPRLRRPVLPQPTASQSPARYLCVEEGKRVDICSFFPYASRSGGMARCRFHWNNSNNFLWDGRGAQRTTVITYAVVLDTIND